MSALRIVYLNIALEMAIVCLQSPNVSNNKSTETKVSRIDLVFLVTMVFYLTFSVLWFMYFKTKNYSAQTYVVRIGQGTLLAGMSALMMYNAWLANSAFRMTIGVAAAVDVLLYLYRFQPRIEARAVNPPTTASSLPDLPPVYILPNDVPLYEPPPSYFEVAFPAVPKSAQELGMVTIRGDSSSAQSSPNNNNNNNC